MHHGMVHGRRKYKNKGNDPRREICVSVRFTKDEAKVLDQKRGCMQRGTFLREFVLNNKIHTLKIPSVNTKAYVELARIGKNINQVVREMNRIGATTRQLDNILFLIKDLRQACLGMERDLE